MRRGVNVDVDVEAHDVSPPRDVDDLGNHQGSQ